LNQFNPFHAPTFQFLKIHLNIILRLRLIAVINNNYKTVIIIVSWIACNMPSAKSDNKTILTYWNAYEPALLMDVF
jgi:hypothetical protein